MSQAAASRGRTRGRRSGGVSLKGAANTLLRDRMAALRGARRPAYLQDRSRLLRSGRLALPPLATLARGALTLAAALSCALPAVAGETVVYRCLSADGRIRFEANPCGADAAAVTLRPSPSSTPPAATTRPREAAIESPQSFALRQQRLAQIESELGALARERAALRERHADERLALAVREPPSDLKPAQRTAYEKARVREREAVERRQVKEMEFLERRAARLEQERARLLRPGR